MDLKALEKRLGYFFKQPELLRLALVHSSYTNEHSESIGSNQRLEFLGDAVVDLVVAEDLYSRYPFAQEGRLTQMRSLLVSGETLGRVAQAIGIGEHLVLGVGEHTNAGRQRPSNLAAAFEAITGAIFLDGGYSNARTFTLMALEQEISEQENSELLIDPKSRLQELAQSKGWGPPSYNLVKEEGLPHDKQFSIEVVLNRLVYGTGKGQKKSDAEKLAAVEAIAILESNH